LAVLVSIVKRTMKSSEQIDTILKKRGNSRFELIEILQDIQALYNHLPEDLLNIVAEKLEVHPIEVFKVANFYKAFTLKPRGKHLLTVCLGTACHVRGAPKFLDEVLGQLKVTPGQTTDDGEITLETVNCLGACALGPVVVLDGKYHRHMTAGKLRALLQETRNAKSETIKKDVGEDDKIAEGFAGTGAETQAKK
jgi:NADH:ubiquinone oxidoreductase subunit E